MTNGRGVPVQDLLRLHDLVVKIAPRRIAGSNCAGFPRTWPVFDVLFSLDCGVRRVENFEVNEFIDCILGGVARNATSPVLMDPTHEIVCHANIQCAAGTTGEDVDVELFHDKAFRNDLSWPGLSRPSRLGRQCVPSRDHRDKPGDDRRDKFTAGPRFARSRLPGNDGGEGCCAVPNASIR